MTARTALDSNAAPKGAARTAAVLQFKCACRSTPAAGEACPKCGGRRAGPLQPRRAAAAADPHELEADRIADRVMRDHAPSIATSPLPVTALSSTSDSATAAPEFVGAALVSGGSPLDAPTRAFFEPRFGRDFSRVRVHADPAAAASARRLGAEAYTVGEHIAFAAGRFVPGSAHGGHLLAHELAHVAQQAASGFAPAVQRQASSELERVRDYLSYGLFDWRISDAEAVAALELLKTLPRFQQAEFVSDRKYVDRLRENLPRARVAELAAIEADVAGMVPPRSDLERVIENLSYGLFDWAITDQEAIEALEILKKLPDERLAVALSRIDYGRLMDNLPPQRRQELIDLLAKGLGTGGLREIGEKREPGFALRSLAFTSDHGVMRDNDKDWSAAGTPYPQPEWRSLEPGKALSAPISHTMDRHIDAELGFDVLPASATPANVNITGDSDVDFLRFSHTATMSGGTGKTAAMSSIGKLPTEVTAFRDKYIDWKVKWGAWEHEVARTGPFTLFVTIADPANPGAVTYRRMAKAVELVASSPTLDSHDIVKTIMFRWTNFNLDVRYANEWDLAGDMETGAQCIDLVRFVQSVIGMVGAPGTAEAVVVWAKPPAPDAAIERPWPHAGMSSSEVAPHPGEPSWSAALLDGDMRPNNYEAALKFTDGGVMRYYPGGVPEVMTTPDEVLGVFNCLAWIKPVGGNRYEIMEIPASYRAGACVVGERHRW
jgi:hypothetical protein